MQTKKIDWLIAGLGNPGRKYAATRHNIGWMVAMTLCEKYKKPLVQASSLHLEADVNISNNNVLIALPLTFMNNSGEALKPLMDKYEIPLDRLIVIADEYNFPVGKLHLRLGSSDGGHNGFFSVIEHLDDTEFFRLRCGIGKNFPSGMLVDYVLSDFTREEFEERDAMILRAVDSLECLVRLGKSRALSLINSGALWKKEESHEESPKPVDLPSVDVPPAIKKDIKLNWLRKFIQHIKE